MLTGSNTAYQGGSNCYPNIFFYPRIESLPYVTQRTVDGFWPNRLKSITVHRFYVTLITVYTSYFSKSLPQNSQTLLISNQYQCTIYLIYTCFIAYTSLFFMSFSYKSSFCCHKKSLRRLHLYKYFIMQKEI